MNKKAVVWILVLIVVLVAGWAYTHRQRDTEQAPSAATTSVPVATQPDDGWKTYDSSTYRFTVRYPQDWSVDEKYTYTALGPGKELPGVAFKVPESLTKGTNLSTDSAMTVEIGKGSCTATSFIDGAQEQSTTSENGRTWSVAKGGGAGAGNFYDETVYATSVNNTCYGLRLFIHSTNIGNYPPGTVNEFDRNALDDAFAQFRASFNTK